MIVKLQKWGNSQGLRLPKALLEEAKMDVGDAVRLRVQKQGILLEPVRKRPRSHRLKDLVERIPKEYKAHEVTWGRPEGKEAW